MWHKAGLVGITLAGALSVGCGQQQTYGLSELDNVIPGMDAFNSPEQNGVKMNGVKMNGVKMNGIALGNITLHVNQVGNGSVQALTDDLTTSYTDAQLKGAVLVAAMQDGTLAQFRVDDVQYSPSFGGNLYTVSIYDGTSWQPACGYDPSGYYAPPTVPIPTVPLFGVWDLATGDYSPDPSTFTFGCINAAIGKCVTWGYVPWNATQTECQGGTCHNIDMSEVHMACTRLVRADYCGNGVYHTVTGTGLDVYDTFGIQTRSGVSGYSLEAEWAPDGGHCINHTRWTKADSTMDTAYATDYAYVQATCPSRLAANDPTCGSSDKYTTQYGFSLPLTSRPTIREETYQH